MKAKTAKQLRASNSKGRGFIKEKVTAKESLERLKQLREERREWVAKVKKTLLC